MIGSCIVFYIDSEMVRSKAVYEMKFFNNMRR